MGNKKTRTAAEIRGELIKRGYTVSSWARANGYRPSTVFEAIRGNRHGIISTEIRSKLEQIMR